MWLDLLWLRAVFSVGCEDFYRAEKTGSIKTYVWKMETWRQCSLQNICTYSGDVMNNNKTIAIVASLATLMAVTRFNHFGSAISLPDASLAIFFLGGLYLAQSTRASIAAFIAMILEAGMVDYYAISIQGVSDWCMTPAYGFLIPTYGSLWLIGRWFALRHSMEGRGLAGLAVTAWVASSFAFLFSNVTFYMFSDYFGSMSVVEYMLRIAQYYGSYISSAMLYVAGAVGIQMAAGIIGKQKKHSQLV